jgi:hypothetical protein
MAQKQIRSGGLIRTLEADNSPRCGTVKRIDPAQGAIALGEMMSETPPAIAARLMSEFAQRTGLSPAAASPRRYLWTDAFAVCNFLELSECTGDQQYRRCAKELIDQVHRELGRYRSDDVRKGWISGLDDERGCHHPTLGGLRIGKPLTERAANESIDEQREWDRDGQYFHYLTKWIHALCQAAFVLGDNENVRWARELAEAAFRAFVCRSESGELMGVYWKMSTDLSRPLVPTMGLHDALDGYITFREVQRAIAKVPDHPEVSGFNQAADALFALCQRGEWTTDDPLGVGGLLFDACRLGQLLCQEQPRESRLLEALIQGCCNSLTLLLRRGYLNRPMQHRLAFRELGLAIGLKALPIIANAMGKNRSTFESRPALRQTIDLLLPYEALSDEIIGLWLRHAELQHESWKAHQDINEVMLATAIVPDTFLSVGERYMRQAR